MVTDCFVCVSDSFLEKSLVSECSQNMLCSPIFEHEFVGLAQILLLVSLNMIAYVYAKLQGRI